MLKHLKHLNAIYVKMDNLKNPPEQLQYIVMEFKCEVSIITNNLDYY